MALPCKTRVIWRRPDCLKPSPQGWKCAFSDTQRPEQSHRHQTTSLRVVPTLPGRWTVDKESTQGDGKAAYVALDTSSARGIRDCLRGASPMVTECQ